MIPRHLLPRIGSLPRGPRDAITDVAGVTVGHCTLDADDVQTGVTVVLPRAGDLFRERVPAASVVLNGFGKSVGLMQVEELGVLETPIALTNTFSVAAVATAQIEQCIAANPECGRSLPTVNPLVFECNDGYLNDIQRMAVTGAHYLQAWEQAGVEVAEGSVGAGPRHVLLRTQGRHRHRFAPRDLRQRRIHRRRAGAGQLRPIAAVDHGRSCARRPVGRANGRAARA